MLVLAVILGIVGTTDIYSSKASDVTQGKTLKIVSAVLFVVISICLFLRAIGNVQGDTSGKPYNFFQIYPMLTPHHRY